MINTSWCCYKDRQVSQWNRIEEQEITDKEDKIIQWKKESMFNKWCLSNWQSACRKMQLDPYLSPYTKFKSMWVRNLHINPDTLNLIERNLEVPSNTLGQRRLS